MLEQYYGFKTIYLTRSDHTKIDGTPKFVNGFINTKNIGILEYYSTSEEFNQQSNMNEEKWITYTKFTFVRNPYDRFNSGIKYCQKFENDIINIISGNSHPYVLSHCRIPQNQHLYTPLFPITEIIIKRFETLESDFIDILKEIGFEKTPHLIEFLKNTLINCSKDPKPYYESIDVKTLEFINTHFNFDFNNFNYPVVKILEDLYDNYRVYGIRNISEIRDKILIEP
jgi:hypothetical protein